MKKILVITAVPHDDWASKLARELQNLGLVAFAREGDLSEKWSQESYDLFVVDASAVGSADQLVSRLRAALPDGRVVVMTASPTWRRARAVFEAGGMDYLSKDLQGKDLVETFRSILRKPAPKSVRGVHNEFTHSNR
jgi:DNA-binding response OmpR family regulator